jgi:hypothetical protein
VKRYNPPNEKRKTEMKPLKQILTRMRIFLALATAMLQPCFAAGPSPWQQPAAALAGQIADILGPGEARLTIENLSSIPTSEIPAIRKLLEADLKSHGVTVSGAESASSLRVTLSENARERLWVAEVIEGNHSQVAIVELGPAAAAPHEEAAGGLLLRSQVILSTHEPVLAALEASGNLIILEPGQLLIDAQSSGGWSEVKKVDLIGKGALARDPRGALLGYANGSSFASWLPGVECVGSVASSSQPVNWAIDCRGNDDPWAITQPNLNLTSFGGGNAQENVKVTPIRAFYNAARNYFTGVLEPNLGTDLPPFYSAALVTRPAGGAALLIGGIDGKVQLAENGAMHPIAGTRDWGSDFAVLKSGCGAGEQIVASGSGEAVHDSLRAYEIPALEAIPASAPLAMDGTVTAMWSTPDGKSVYAVVRSAADQYEVDRVSALCN